MRLAGSPVSTGRVLGSSTGLGTTVAADDVNLNVQYYRLTFYWCVIIVFVHVHKQQPATRS